MIRRSVFKCRIEVSNRPRVFNGIVAKCLMKIPSTTITLSLCQRFDKFCNFSDAILRQFVYSINEFLPFHGRNYSTLSPANWSNSSTPCSSRLCPKLRPPTRGLSFDCVNNKLLPTVDKSFAASF